MVSCGRICWKACCCCWFFWFIPSSVYFPKGKVVVRPQPLRALPSVKIGVTTDAGWWEIFEVQVYIWTQSCWLLLLVLFASSLKISSGILLVIRIMTQKETGQNTAKAALAGAKGIYRAQYRCLGSVMRRSGLELALFIATCCCTFYFD